MDENPRRPVACSLFLHASIFSFPDTSSSVAVIWSKTRLFTYEELFFFHLNICCGALPDKCRPLHAVLRCHSSSCSTNMMFVTALFVCAIQCAQTRLASGYYYGQTENGPQMWEFAQGCSAWKQRLITRMDLFRYVLRSETVETCVS